MPRYVYQACRSYVLTVPILRPLIYLQTQVQPLERQLKVRAKLSRWRYKYCSGEAVTGSWSTVMHKVCYLHTGKEGEAAEGPENECKGGQAGRAHSESAVLGAVSQRLQHYAGNSVTTVVSRTRCTCCCQGTLALWQVICWRVRVLVKVKGLQIAITVDVLSLRCWLRYCYALEIERLRSA